jgi:hypothetical protein
MVRGLTEELQRPLILRPFWYRGTRDEFLTAGAGRVFLLNACKIQIKSVTLQRILEKGRVMCTCIAEIKASYTKVRHQTAEVAQQQFDIDDYLDKVNVVRKKLEQITEETNNLVETVRDHFTEFDIQETTELLAHSTPILILMDQLHQKLVESSLYPGLKTAVEDYCDCVSIFQELCSDLQTFNIDLRQDEEFQKTSELLRSIA